MSKKNVLKKIVMVGVPVERQPVIRDQLHGRHKIIFAASSSEALGDSAGADIIAVNVDNNKTFLDQVFERGYEGLIVVITGSRKIMGEMMVLPNNKKVKPVCCRTAPDEIIRLLAV